MRAIEKLNGDNFHTWKFKMEMVLQEKDLWDIVTGDEERPKESAEAIVFDKRARRAMATICLSVQDSLLGLVRPAKSAPEAWQKLVQHFEQKGLAHKLFLRRKFFTLQMAEGEDMMQHIQQVLTMAEQLEAIGAKVSEEDQVMTLLCSLPESYGNLIVALESRADSLSMEFVTARLMHEQEKRKEAGAKLASEAAFYSKQTPTRAEPARAAPSRGRPGKCNFCGKPGHWARECRQRLEQQGKPQAEAHAASHDQEFLFMAQDGADAAQHWYVDSGASQHLTPHRAWFADYQPIPAQPVFMGDDHPQQAVGKGTIHMQLDVHGEAVSVKLTNVLHVPGIANNLLSVSKLALEGHTVEFGVEECLVRHNSGKVLARAVRDKNLYKLVVHKQVICANAALTGKASAQLWHERLGHLSKHGMDKLKPLVEGLDGLQSPCQLELCKGCVQGKQHRKAFPKCSASHAKQVLELVHTDICGPMRTATLGGSKYFMTFIDDKSRKVFVYFLKSKAEALAKFQDFQHMVEKATGRHIKVLRSDNGGEYVSKAFTLYLQQQGIRHQTTAPYSPEQNGVAERANRTLVEAARSMLHARGMDHKFWGEAVATAAYLRNRCSTKAVLGMTPEEAWSGAKPSVNHLKVFGCRAFVHVPKEKRTKLDAKTKECVMVGYCEDSKAYRLYCPCSKQLVKSRDVVFDEQWEPTLATPMDSPPSQSTLVLEEPRDEECSKQQPAHVLLEEPLVEPAPSNKPVDAQQAVREAQQQAPNQGLPVRSGGDGSAAVRRSSRIRHAPGEWWKASGASHSDGSRHEAHLAMCSEPQTLQQALSGSDAQQWKQAMDEEYESLTKNHTWQLVPLPPGRKAIGNKWVFKVKYHADGTVERYKARLVAKGYAQTHGIDYNETFAPVAKFTTIRSILAMAAMEDLEVHQMDVKTAFLNGDLEEDIYMDQPEGYVSPQQQHLVCKLQKSLYGLKQSPRAWYHKIDQYFQQEGFQRSEADHSLYVRLEGTAKVIIALYVDDLILLSDSMDALNQVKHSLAATFEMKDLGEIHYCLGIQVVRDRKHRLVRLGQEKYVLDVLHKFGMDECKPIGTPLDANSKLTKDMAPKSPEEEQRMESVPYRQAVGSLMYAMVGTRPDIAYAVGAVSQFLSSPGEQHWQAVKRIFRYLRGTSHHMLLYGGTPELALTGHCDADWAGSVDDRRSTTGYVFTIAGGCVSWNSKKQATVALSTTEAEYMAAAQATKEAVWLRQLLADLGYELARPTVLHTDSQGCIALVKNPAFHNRTKHIDIQHHFIREKAESGVVVLQFCNTQDMMADILTKGLSKEKHEHCKELMGLQEPQQ